MRDELYRTREVEPGIWQLTDVLEDIKRIPGVSKTRTHLVLRTDKNVLSPLPEATK